MVRVGLPAFVGICSHSTLVVFITAQQIAFITVPRFSTESDFYVPELDCTDFEYAFLTYRLRYTL